MNWTQNKLLVTKWDPFYALKINPRSMFIYVNQNNIQKVVLV